MRRLLVLVLGVALAVGAYLTAGAVAWATTTEVDTSCMTLHGDVTPATFTAIWGTGSLQPDTAPYRFDAQEAAIPSRTAGISLGAWWAPPADPRAGAVIVVHGKLSCRHDPVVLLPAGMLHRAGFGVLMIDLRNHGTSDGDNGHWAGGADEWLDVLGAFDWLRGRGFPAASIGLVGLSMGAGAVSLAVGNEPAVPAAWLDSPYADIVSMSMEVAKASGNPEWLVPGALLMGQLIGGDNFLGDSPERAFAERLAGRPVAIVHGTADTTIPVAQGERLAEAATRGGTPVVPWIVDGARHVESAFVQTAEYERRLAAFFRVNLATRVP
jgi:alpha-beta hydrolase superfamily lysophospholipase